MTQILCLILMPIAYVGALIHGAQSRPHIDGADAGILRWLSLGLIIVTALFGLSILFWAAQPLPAEMATEIAATGESELLERLAPPTEQALPAFALVILCCALALAVLWSAPFRHLLASAAFRGGAFRAERSTHVIALILSLVSLALIFGSQAFSSAETVAASVSLEQLLLQSLIFLACAALGVGYPMRRDERRTLARLGLRLPTSEEWLFGIGGGLGLLILVALGSLLWQLIASPQAFAEQQAFAREVSANFRGLPLMLALAALSALSEETLFRGALQPVFGPLATSAFFALFHMQYGFTPALLLLFAVGLGLAILRQRYSTSAAIIAHFTFNFAQLALGRFG